MLGVALPALGALGGVSLLASVQVTPIVTARAEAAAGEAPLSPGEPSEATVMTELRAGAGMRLRTARTQLQLGVEPRLSYQTPSLSDLDRPLLLARSELAHSYQFSRRLQWLNSIEVSAGEVEYTQAELLLNTPIARELEDPVVVAFSISANSALAWQRTRRYQLSLGPAVQNTTTLSGDTPAAPPSTTAVGVDFNQTYQLSLNGTLSLPIGYREYFISESEDQRTVTAGLAYQRALGRRTTLEASAGAAAAEGAEQPFAVLPQGGVAINRVVYATRTGTISNRIAARVLAAFDPTRAELYPTAGIEAALFVTSGGNWRASLAGEAYTTLTERPVSEDDADSRAALNAAVGYLLSEEISLDFGFRFTTRASHFSEDLRLTDRTTLGFVALSAAFELVPAERRRDERARR